jgi:hypothetical protein
LLRVVDVVQDNSVAGENALDFGFKGGGSHDGWCERSCSRRSCSRRSC